MQFLLDMQAKHDAQFARNEAQIQKNSVQIEKNSAQIEKNSVQLAAVTDLIGRLAQAETRLVERMDQASEENRERFLEVARRFEDTDYKLNALIETVDKLVKRNGRHSKPGD